MFSYWGNSCGSTPTADSRAAEVAQELRAQSETGPVSWQHLASAHVPEPQDVAGLQIRDSLPYREALFHSGAPQNAWEHSSLATTAQTWVPFMLGEPCKMPKRQPRAEMENSEAGFSLPICEMGALGQIRIFKDCLWSPGFAGDLCSPQLDLIFDCIC